LPDGKFAHQKYQFYIFEGLEMENVGIFMSIPNILRPFYIFYGHLVHCAKNNLETPSSGPKLINE
jgi:hypothetical protein